MAKKHSPKFLQMVGQARTRIPECSAIELKTMLEDGSPLVVIDVRERHEFEAGHLEGSVHIGKGVLERDIEKHELSDNARLVLYCGGGFRSAIAAASLKDMGYSNAFSLWGGWRAIVAEGLAPQPES
ncbi:MAG TPA: sulfurtransferase [Candidatus Poseidoniales archaeon]|nr:MAG TPA: sulfurtransferase [Candidatus Poseidoniales archaeon]HII22066.1 sulfurtransferase [Candidatus Poseidoniaceae archaeon]